MRIKTCWILFILIGVVSAARAATYTATNNANWNTAATWDPNGVPGPSDLAVIPVGRTVTYGGAPATVGAVQISGTLSLSSAGTFGDVWIDTTGTFNPTTSGANITFAGNVTNNGSMTIASLGSATPYTYTGTDKILAGTISNVIAVINGTYRNLGTFMTGLKGTQDALKGSGALTNLATLILTAGQNTTPSLAVLDCSAVGNLVTWTGFNGTATPKATGYYDLILGHTGSSGWNLNGAGLTIAHDLTIVNNAPISSWPSDNTIPGTFTYSASSTTASTFPTAFSVGNFSQTSGRLTVPASATLTVTGAGAGAWTRSGGSFTPATTGTVRFAGSAPDLGGTVTNGFSSLLIDSTAASATASAPLYVTNTLTIASGGSLDVTALSGGAHAMLGAESFFGSGTLKGSVTTVSGSKIYGGTDGAYGANQITAGLTMATNSTVNLDVNTSAGAANDQLIVGGALTLTNTAFRLKAPSAGAAIDTGSDYTLATAASISGTPVLNWVTPPANSNNYALVVSSTAIKLHYGGTPGSPVLNVSRSGGNLTLSWDTNTFPGFNLQGQTNSGGLGAGWGVVPGGNVSPFTLAIDSGKVSVFFRLAKP